MQATENTVVNFEAQSVGARIAIASTKGGAGTSSIVANIAWGLAAQDGVSVACADLDFATGDLDLHFSVESNQALLEMLQYPDRLEPIIYQRSGIKVTDDLHVFTGYRNQLEQSFWPDATAINKMSQFCQQQASFLLWDIPAFCLRDIAGFATFSASDIGIIVVEPTLASLRSTNQLLAKLTAPLASQTNSCSASSHGNTRQQIIVVLNNTKPESASLITKADVEKALARKIAIEIPYAPQQMLASTTLGTLAINQKNRNSKALQKLVQLISKDQTSQTRGFFKWRKEA